MGFKASVWNGSTDYQAFWGARELGRSTRDRWREKRSLLAGVAGLLFALLHGGDEFSDVEVLDHGLENGVDLDVLELDL